MDLVLVGLPGSGKSAVGRRVASRHGAVFVDLDDTSSASPAVRSRELFASEGEAASGRWSARPSPRSARPIRRPSPPRDLARRRRDRRPPQPLGALPRPAPGVAGRPHEVLAQRLRRSPNVRPLIQGGDPMGRVRQLAAARERFYGAALRVKRRRRGRRRRRRGRGLVAPPASPSGTTLLRASTKHRRRRHRRGHRGTGRGERFAAWARGGRSSSPSRGHGRPSARASRRTSRAAGWPVEELLLPAARKRSGCRSSRTRRASWRGLRVERREPLVAIGGGALGDPAGFLAATYLRGVPWIQRPDDARRPGRLRRSAARPAWTCPRERTSSARSTTRPRS